MPSTRHSGSHTQIHGYSWPLLTQIREWTYPRVFPRINLWVLTSLHDSCPALVGCGRFRLQRLYATLDEPCVAELLRDVSSCHWCSHGCHWGHASDIRTGSITELCVAGLVSSCQEGLGGLLAHLTLLKLLFNILIHWYFILRFCRTRLYYSLYTTYNIRKFTFFCRSSHTFLGFRAC